ncbi:NAD(P)H-hydrate dehydratase [Arabiibacter massiliensis]|uniref:NAD(P)H-hydrate dehydratase n=1 Tax=Arabiibacter massiliensis TaxID=1870985 RepID=UPI0009BAD23F|nr:NAD(P)H-hydrate dehydratase [Arabiibacter massiliensis]
MVDVREYTPDELLALVPFPAREANKYSRGKLTAVVGSARYPGAACLVACASQRMGAGYTEVVTAPEVVGLVRACSPSLVVRPTEGLATVDLAPSRAGKPCAYVVGSGFDAQDDEAARLVHFVLKRAEAPVLVDGGGLQALATKKGQRLLKRRFILGWPTVVTPHAGEAARLAAPFGLPVADPAELACSLALAYGVVAVVKGPETVISDGEQTVRMALGTPALAKAGTGDVLAGMTGALLAQGLDPLDAAALGTTLHALAGRAAEERLTAVCVTAEDVIEAIPAALAAL